MGWGKKLMDAFSGKEEPLPVQKAPRKKKSPKDIATENGEPYFVVVGLEFNPENLREGSFELDWNDKMVKDLRAAGYQGRTDEDVVDNYFTDVCRNVVLETYQNEMADPDQRQILRRDIGGGRSEYY